MGAPTRTAPTTPAAITRATQACSRPRQGSSRRPVRRCSSDITIVSAAPMRRGTPCTRAAAAASRIWCRRVGPACCTASRPAAARPAEERRRQPPKSNHALSDVEGHAPGGGQDAAETDPAPGGTAMNRRRFMSRSGAGAAATLAALSSGGFSIASQSVAAQGQGRKRALMKVGASIADAYDLASLNAALRYGVKNVTAAPRIAEPGRLYATVDELMKMRELPDRLGVSVDLLTPPNLASSHIDREANPGIML